MTLLTRMLQPETPKTIPVKQLEQWVSLPSMGELYENVQFELGYNGVDSDDHAEALLIQ